MEMSIIISELPGYMSINSLYRFTCGWHVLLVYRFKEQVRQNISLTYLLGMFPQHNDWSPSKEIQVGVSEGVI